MTTIDREQLAALAAHPSPTLHPGTKCQHCGASPIRGIRYKCNTCYDFDYCAQCEDNCEGKHPKTHLFLKVRHPIPPETLLLGSGGPVFFNPDEEQ